MSLSKTLKLSKSTKMRTIIKFHSLNSGIVCAHYFLPIRTAAWGHHSGTPRMSIQLLDFSNFKEILSETE